MLSKIKQMLDPHKETEGDNETHTMSLTESEIQRLHTENEELRERLNHLQNQNKLPRIHMEFFYFHPNTAPNDQFSELDLDHLPIMCVTLHFMEKDKPIPYWIEALLTGLEETLSSMKIQYRKVAEPHLYSIFVDTKLYPHQEVKKILHLLVKQMEQLHRQDERAVTVRVHVGGDELYDDLLAVYQEQR